jgi:hypothetical protein
LGFGRVDAFTLRLVGATGPAVGGDGASLPWDGCAPLGVVVLSSRAGSASFAWLSGGTRPVSSASASLSGRRANAASASASTWSKAPAGIASDWSDS